MPAAELAGLRATFGTMFERVATVYTEHATTGAYSVQAQVDLPCHLASLPLRSATTAQDRAELASLRVLKWPYSYVLPETAQVEIDAVRWQPRAGTFEAIRAPGTDAILYRQADVVRVQGASF